MHFTKMLLITGLFGLCCSTVHAETLESNTDPYEHFNRHAYHLNDGLDRAIFKPIATVYKTILPWPVTKGISNVFSNLGDISTLANELLQGKFRQASSDVCRITVNSTVGLLGLIDVGSRVGLEKHNEDLGLTLAHWGYRSSHYLVVPIFGPRTVRDTLALPVDLRYLTVYPYIHDVRLRNSLMASRFISARADALQFEKVIKEASFDPYEFQRNAYLQYRRGQINKGTQAATTADTYVSE